MPWAEPNYSREEVNAAATKLAELLEKYSDEHLIWSDGDATTFDRCIMVINNWRACHGYPLNTFQTNLRRSAKKIDGTALIAQRTKRLRSIAYKLGRQPTMKLTQMQDIGGCRAVVKSVLAVRRLDRFYTKESEIKHELATRDDYIQSPRKSGYRGIHLVYRYFSDKKMGEKYNGLKIETQLRSQYQHAWATTVETVGTFIGEALKSSSGPEDWQRFFALMGSVIALRERTPLVPDTPTSQRQLIDELHDHAKDLNVQHLLRGYAETLRQVEEDAEQAHYYLLKLDPGASQLTVTGFRREEFEQAQQAYSEAERQVKEQPGTDAVLVSVDSLAALRRAYPNYFADTRVFVQLLDQALSGRPKRIFTGQLKLDAASS
jgi:hypothetical protein